MEIICTRPNCTQPRNFFSVDRESELRTVKQRYCRTCGMELLLADRYLPIELLGQGGFGAAYLARDRYQPNLPLCVVKQFKPSTELSDRAREAAQQLFIREATVLADLGQKHPQIPNLYAFFTPIVPNIERTGEEQYFYLAQEFIDGQNLEQEVEVEGIFSESKVTNVLTEMLKILKFVHGQHIIHRDIKPDNIMRDRQGVLYLLDFGAVKQIATGSGNQKKTTSIYSAGYAPPEQVSGLQIYPATDLYALAVTCLNLLTGKPVEELYDLESNTWQWNQFVPHISDRLKQILDRMLLPSPAQRFQSASSVLEALATSSVNKGSNSAPAKFSSPPQPQPTLIPKSNQSDRSSQPKPLVSFAPPAHNVPPAFDNVNIPIVPAVPNPKLTLPIRKKRKKRPFTRTDILFFAGFTGFEGSLIYLGLTNWLSPSAESLAVVMAMLGIIIFVLYRRVFKQIDLLIIAAISAGIVAFVPKLQGSLSAPIVLIVAIFSAAMAIAITVFWRWGYKLFSRLSN